MFWQKSLSKIILFVFVFAIVFVGFAIMTEKWSKIRDVRRRSDATTIIRALDYYYSQYGHYPEVVDDDKDGWDFSNDISEGGANFLAPVVKAGYLKTSPFDPKNDNVYYYRYKKFAAGEYGCEEAFYVLQVARFETDEMKEGYGSCPNLDWTRIAPQGFTALHKE